MEPQYNDFRHFTHDHPLEYTNSPCGRKRTCSACKLCIMPEKMSYQCRKCEFFLHRICYKMPRKILHPADPNHHLFLSPSKTASTECESCTKIISGFSYSCEKCIRYFHVLCIAMPLSVKIPTSHPHLLKLEMKPEYDSQCDLCEKPNYKTGWLYRCRLCEFDAHISCVLTLKDMRSPRLSSVPEIDGSFLDSRKRVGGANSYQNELMELLLEGMKGYDMKVHVQEKFQQPQDQSILISEDFTLISYQFSDACFSIDIANSFRNEENKSLAIGENNGYHYQMQCLESKQNTTNGNTTVDSKNRVEKLEIARRFDSDSGNTSPKRPLGTRTSNGIGSHVWTELDREKNNGKADAANKTMQLKDETRKLASGNLRRNFWSKFFLCF